MVERVQVSVKEDKVMRTYKVEIVKSCNEGKAISIEGLVLSRDLKVIREKLGDISKYPIGKKFKVKC